MIDREIPPGPTRTGRIICPVGSASRIVRQAWFSASFDNGARVEAWFQKAAPGSDGPAPGAGTPLDWTLRNAERPCVEVPNGTEFIQYRVSNIEGAGVICVELLAN